MNELKMLQVEQKTGLPRHRIHYLISKGFIEPRIVTKGKRREYVFTQRQVLSLMAYAGLRSVGFDVGRAIEIAQTDDALVHTPIEILWKERERALGDDEK